MRNSKQIILYCFMFFLSAVAVIICVFNGNLQDGTIWYSLLPICYCVNLLQINGKMNIIFSSITGVVVFLLYTIRLVVTPVAMAIGNYESTIPLELYNNYIIWAVLLIIFEAVVVFLVLPNYIAKKINEIERKQIIEQPDTRTGLLLWVVVLMMSSFIIYMIKRDPSLWKANFLLLIDYGKTYHAYSSSATGIGTLSMYVEIMNSFFKVIQVLLPILLILALNRLRMPNRLLYLLSFAIFGMVTIVATEDRIDAIFAGLALLLTIKTLYGNVFEKHFKTMLIVILSICFIGLCIKAGVIDNTGQSLSDSFEKIASMLSAYFSGVPTVALGIKFVLNLGFFNIWRIIPDIIAHIPFVGYALNLFFGISVESSNHLFNEFIRSEIGRNIGQILPTTIVGMEYFSALFAPLAASLMIKLAVWLEGKGKQESNAIKIHVFNWITICVAGSPIVASSLLITAKLSWFFFIYLLVSILGKKTTRITFH